jgi:hypothetical protein
MAGKEDEGNEQQVDGESAWQDEIKKRKDEKIKEEFRKNR